MTAWASPVCYRPATPTNVTATRYGRKAGCGYGLLLLKPGLTYSGKTQGGLKETAVPRPGVNCDQPPRLQNYSLYLEAHVVREIQLTQGFVTLVDDDMFDYLSQWKWCVQVGKWGPYAMRNGFSCEGRKRTIRMHRVIINAKEREQVDHWDTDGLNNQRANLRLCTNSQNACNRRVNNLSRFKGVYWHKERKWWRAQLKINGKCVHLGHFYDSIQAALAYDAGARKYFGQFARTNFLEV